MSTELSPTCSMLCAGNTCARGEDIDAFEDDISIDFVARSIVGKVGLTPEQMTKAADLYRDCNLMHQILDKKGYEPPTPDIIAA